MPKILESRHGDVTNDEASALLASATSTTDRPTHGYERSGETLSTREYGTAIPDDRPEDGENCQHDVSRRRAALGTASLGLLILLQAMNISLVTTTQGSIAEDLNVSEGVVWFSASYLIAMSALNPLISKLSSIFSSRTCIFISSLFLATGSFIAAFAPNLRTFIVGRVLSGSGASGILTVSTIVVLELVGTKRRGLAMAGINSGYTFGISMGAIVAGALEPNLGWRASLYLQVPLTVIAGFGILFALPSPVKRHVSGAIHESEEETIMTRLKGTDSIGAISLTASIVLLLYSLSVVGEIPLLLLLLSGATFAIFLFNEVCFAADPIVPVSLMTSRALLATCLSTGGYMMARWAAVFYAPTFALAVRGWSPTVAGTLLIPTNIGFAVGGILVGWIHIKRSGSFYLPSIVALTLFPCTMIAMAWLATPASPAWLFVIALFANGACCGASLNYTLAHLLHCTPKTTHFIAASLMTLFRGLAGSFGTSIGGGVFLRRLKLSLEKQFAQAGLPNEQDLIRHLIASPELVYKLTGFRHTIAMRGYEEAFRFLWLTGAGLAAVMVLVQALSGWAEADREEQPSSASCTTRV